MPVYQFHCSSCNEDFDSFRSIAERAAPISEPCPSCGTKGQVTRLMGTPNLVAANAFKGLSSDFKYAMNKMKKRHLNGKNNIPDY